MFLDKGNSFSDSMENTATISYENLLNLTYRKLDKVNVKVSNKCVNISNLDDVINEIIMETQNHKKGLHDFLGLDSKYYETLTTNFKNEDVDKKLILKLKDKIKEGLIKAEINKFELDDLVNNKKMQTKHFGVNFDFNSKNFKTKNLFTDLNGDNSRLRLDIGEIRIDTFDLDSSFKTCIKDYIINEVDTASENNTKFIFDEIDSKKRDMDKILKLLENDSIARIKRSLGIVYLDYLCSASSNSKFLDVYVKRLYMLEEYLQKLTEENLSKNKFKVKNQNRQLFEASIDDILSQADAFGELPIVALFNKSLEEKQEKLTKTYKFDLRVKLNGLIQTENLKSLDYMIGNIKSGAFDELKSIRVAFLLIFLLNDLDNDSYNPVEFLEKIILENKNNLYDAIKNIVIALESNILENTKKVLNDVSSCIKNKPLKLKCLETKRFVVLDKQLLDDSEESIFENDFYDEEVSGRIFKVYDEFYNGKSLRLKHLAVVKEFDENKYLYGYPINICISSSGISIGSNNNTEELNYEIENKKTVNVLFMPTSHLKNSNYIKRNGNIKTVVEDLEYINQMRVYYIRTLGDIRGNKSENTKTKANILIPYDVYRYLGTEIKGNHDSEFSFFEANKITYTILYNLLSYLFIETILDMNLKEKKIESKDIYISILRQNLEDKRIQNKVHLNNFDIANSFIRTVNKNLEHILSNKYIASSQGRIIKFDKSGLINDSIEKYKQAAALTSLYSKVPKAICAKNISDDKLAFIYVTSSIADKSSEKNINRLLMGEVVKFTFKNKKILCKSFETFQECYDNQNIYKAPIVLKDIALKLSDDGYTKIVFISDAPYSSSLNMISKESEDLYFMNESIIKMMENVSPSIKIYPMFFQDYYIYDAISGGGSESLFMEHSREDNPLKLDDNVKRVFFSLYNGITVGNYKNYKRIGMYSILLNKYSDKTLNQNIEELLNETSDIRNTVIECIKLFHLARFEANKALVVKLNPYSRLNDENSVSKKTIDNYKIGSVKLKFNSLAFLNEVKKTINKTIFDLKEI